VKVPKSRGQNKRLREGYRKGSGWESTVEAEAGISEAEVGVAEAEGCTVAKRRMMVYEI
jgi:hypothetical protein